LKTIHIVTAVNDSYAEHLGVMITSLLRNKASSSIIKLYVLQANLSTRNKTKLQRISSAYGTRIQFLTIQNSQFMGMKQTTNYISIETYYRIIIPKLLHKKIKKVLYLDCDMIVRDDISKLWKVNTKKYYLAAVVKPSLGANRKLKLGMPQKAKYFNAGMLLMNLEKWRKHNVAKKVISYMKNHSADIKFPSQDPLNAVLYGKWKAVKEKWNYTTAHIESCPHVKPLIIHYTGSNKPWNMGHQLQDEYFKYREKTEW
jgi:lipopolysaccharide biosynthesis glycosyltransferase